ncbi:acetyl-CoA carboxylase biotin carboxyl carrier protein [Alicyclobacillus mali]|uniref:Biotin carboxyl carrier protein of acetyl-CoA carboxylase n=1 Tax=Alicyclobacillus mali (ex Roth et al. 2021) TaxID=1123961 RepID=A0ABS0F619_9BACL|nr:acetyl-CoA carboxylase biotin carboxyl carrier protein [Alicyclobacillus mali (ex Roth et al. 2021)]MBF8378713.1 acetyl-CoA carboxylase biotin carboxyl carrier protein [Alicyclobacillus mali (ex Roth et al. 2021)]MCL6487730.1 acetyl-CoA carboxylase biotin carboxyl carrier protein [Alicyclobacillus mali (ex Roth et al. 2021)]
MLTMEEIRELIRLLDDSSLTELELEFEDGKVRLAKRAEVVSYAVPQVAMPVAQAAPVSSAAPQSGSSAPAVEDPALHVITSPMVGTFYRAPAPDAPPFVDVGSQVGPKTVVCIIEAMKLMNEIEAEISGEIVEILAENGQLVEYGQPLFKVRRT